LVKTRRVSEPAVVRNRRRRVVVKVLGMGERKKVTYA